MNKIIVFLSAILWRTSFSQSPIGKWYGVLNVNNRTADQRFLTPFKEWIIDTTK